MEGQRPDDVVSETERQSAFLSAFAMGFAFAAPLTLALVILFVNVSALPLLLAYAVLALIAALSVAYCFVWMRRGSLSQKVFGVQLRSVSQLAGRVAADVEAGRLTSSISDRVREAAAYYSAVGIRRGAMSFVLILLGEFVLLIQAAMLVQQTAAIRAQTLVSEKQLQALEQQNLSLQRQNDLMESQDRNALLWRALFDQPLERSAAFDQLLASGVRRFSGLHLPRPVLSAAVAGLEFDQCRLVAADCVAADLSDTVFTSCSLDNLNAEECVASNTTFRDVDLVGSVFDRATLRGAVFDEVRLLHTTFVGADLRGARFADADLEGVSFRGADLSEVVFEATDLSVELLMDAASLENVVGVSASVLADLEAIVPGKMAWLNAGAR